MLRNAWVRVILLIYTHPPPKWTLLVLWGVAGSDRGFSFKSINVFGLLFSTQRLPIQGFRSSVRRFLGYQHGEFAPCSGLRNRS